jgi:hypothetical protein
MMSLDRVLKRPRLMKALTGLSPNEFRDLVPVFERAWNDMLYGRYVSDPNRQRKPGAGCKGFLPTIERKLFYILFYCKCYPTFDFAGFVFGCNRSKAHERQQVLMPVLETSLGKKQSLPKRKIRSMEEFLTVFPEAKEVFTDGTERPRQRPKKNQKPYYSGKKKRHTNKNIAISDANRRIGYLTATVPGSMHDYTIFKDILSPEHIPKRIRNHLDLGFQGIESDYPSMTVSIPKKKPKGKPHRSYDKGWNKRKASKRIIAEHAFAGVKRLRIVSDVFRNRKKGMSDTVMYVACGLWNYHLDHKAMQT